MESNLIGVELSPPVFVRAAGRTKFNLQLNGYCRPQMILVPADVAKNLEVTKVSVGLVDFDMGEVEMRRVERGGKFLGFNMVLPEVEASRGQHLTVHVVNKTRKAALFYMQAVLAILDERALIAAAMGETRQIAEREAPEVKALKAAGAQEEADR